MDPLRFALTVDVLLVAPSDGGDAVLLVERGHDPYAGAWALPGGFVDPDEPLVGAAVRELEEETGLALDAGVLSQFRTYGDPGRDPRGRTVTVVFAARLTEAPRVVGGDDAAAARWWPWTDLTVAGDGRPSLAFDHATILGDARSAGW